MGGFHVSLVLCMVLTASDFECGALDTYEQIRTYKPPPGKWCVINK